MLRNFSVVIVSEGLPGIEIIIKGAVLVLLGGTFRSGRCRGSRLIVRFRVKMGSERGGNLQEFKKTMALFSALKLHGVREPFTPLFYGQKAQKLF